MRSLFCHSRVGPDFFGVNGESMLICFIITLKTNNSKLIMTYTESVDYLNSFTNYERIGFDDVKGNFNLQNLQQVLDDIKNPQENFQVIHVAGTKGKGSICEFTNSILLKAGHDVGLFTSPHIIDSRERIKFNNESISKEDFSEIVRDFKNVVQDKKITYFEAYTLIAIMYFAKKKVDYAIFEVGLGGRLDATNVIKAKYSVISPISYDHMNVLGESLKEIASEKAGIIKEGSFCVSAPQKDEVLNIIREKCKEMKVPFSIVGKDVTYKKKKIQIDGSEVSIKTQTEEYSNCKINMLGEFQVDNCASAVQICEKIGISKENIINGISKAFIPARFEIISKEPFIVLDGAQNEESAQKLKESVEQILKYDRLLLILGVSKDKDVKGICKELVPIADRVILTKSASQRALDPFLIRGFVKNKPSKVTKDIKEALGIALSRAKKSDIILITGSFYVAGEVKKLLRAGFRY